MEDILIKAGQLFLSLAILITLHELGHFGMMQREAVGSGDPAAAPSQQAFKHALLLGVQIAFGGDERNAGHDRSSFGLASPGEPEYRMNVRPAAGVAVTSA